ncbi:hypothetical protein P280DRAFT_92080 [Massarina eburnea CBS 473.64]|uniref:Purine transporter n=1 Tax=Massarina eburnea CBS 473.64 TaxID=1395130 RepID=A0A6A6RSG6_9PLEO|nr:hypothetical protein P280DRAFT_92080 [Massarina eburnea CBS 473.64]
MEALHRTLDNFNDIVGASTFGRMFRLEGSGHPLEIGKAKFTTELRAGLTSFFTMAYIISINASILSDSGGNCVCNDTTGKDPLCDSNPEYAICLADLNRSMVTGTAALAGFSSFLFGLMTNMPVCLAPGMGLNAYFAYTIVGYHGSGLVPYNLALTAVFVEGFIFIGLSLVGMRQWLVKLIPVSLKIAAACGIGLFLSLIGLGYSTGIGAITGSTSTPTEIAGCPEAFTDANGFCTSHKMTNPTMWVGIFCGGVVTAFLMAFKFKSAMIVGIAIVTIISWPRGTSLTYFPDTPLGDDRFSFFKKVADFHPITTLNVLDWNIQANPTHFVLALFTFLYVDIIDCTATLYSMARFSGVVDPETGDFPRSTIAYCSDAVCISVGALMGLSPVTAFIESGAGIAEGGKTGLTAMTCGVCFFISMFFAPIFASIPPWATGCTLVLVGCLMMRQIVMVNWRYIGDAVPAFVTIMFIPFAYSAAYGLIAGLMTYTALNGLIYITKLVSGGRIVPDDEEHREYWTMKPQGRLPWFITAPRRIADRLNGGVDERPISKDSASMTSSDERFGMRSGQSHYTHNHDLDTIVVDVQDPRREKVFRQI